MNQYVYIAYNANGERVYVGVTNNPKRRLINHRTNGSEFEYLEIVEKYPDYEHRVISRLQQEGCSLSNREMSVEYDDSYEVGDFVRLSEGKKGIKLLHKPTNQIFNSGYEASQQIPGVPIGVANYVKTHPNGKWAKIFEVVR